MITDSTQVSNEFNNFFIESVKNLASGFSSMNDVDQATITISAQRGWTDSCPKSNT